MHHVIVKRFAILLAILIFINIIAFAIIVTP
jgi:hypothetical protein